MTDQRARQIFDAMHAATETVHVIFPEDIYVPANIVIGWAHDALVNVAVDDYVRVHGLLPDGPEGEACWNIIAQGQPMPDLAGAMEILSDLGTHTFERLDVRHRVAVNRMQDVLRPVARACYPKEQHTSRGAADAQVRSLLKRNLEKTPHAHAYQCPHCGFWHVGTTLPKERRA